MVKAVIFDMDGVIYDSEPIHVQSEKEVMLKYGVKITDEELQPYTGSTAKFMFEDLINKYRLKTNFQKIFAEKNIIFFKLIQKELKPIPGVAKLIDLLIKYKIKIGLATSSHYDLWNLVLNKLNIQDKFNTIIGAENITKPKPDPEIFLLTANKLNVFPKDCLVIEDSTNGVSAAKAAGMKCIGFNNSNSKGQDLSKADIIINKFEDFNILKFINIT